MTSLTAIVGLVVGVGLVVIGVIVLLKYPHRPGGKIKWGDIEVSSEGPGLIILVLGVIVFSFFAYNAPPIDIFPGCWSKQLFANDPKDTIVNLEEGSHDKDLITLEELKDRTLNIKFTENKELIGGMKVKFFPDNNMFKIESILNVQCQEVKKYINATRGILIMSFKIGM
jgi:amino acid transporter